MLEYSLPVKTWVAQPLQIVVHISCVWHTGVNRLYLPQVLPDCSKGQRGNEVRILGTSDSVMENQSGSPAVGSLNHLATTVAVYLARGYQ